MAERYGAQRVLAAIVSLAGIVGWIGMVPVLGVLDWEIKAPTFGG